MSRKRQTPAPKGVVWDPDTYNISEFFDGLNDLRTKPESTMVPPAVMERLAGLAHVVDNEVFRTGITFSVEAARKDFPLLSSPLYRRELDERIAKVREAASHLRDELQAIEKPADRTTLWARRVIIGGLLNTTSSEPEWVDTLNPLAPYLRDLSVLIDAIEKPKSTPYLYFAKKREHPRAPGNLAWRLLDSSHILDGLRWLLEGAGP